MSIQIAENIQQLINLGHQRAEKFHAQKIAQWNETVELIKKDWITIEQLVKDELPVEIQEYFSISCNHIPEYYKEPTSVYQGNITRKDVEDLIATRPNITIIDQSGSLTIPGLAEIIVKIEKVDEKIKVSYKIDETPLYAAWKYELDGSLEMALYYAKVYRDNEVANNSKGIASHWNEDSIDA